MSCSILRNLARVIRSFDVIFDANERTSKIGGVMERSPFLGLPPTDCSSRSSSCFAPLLLLFSLIGRFCCVKFDFLPLQRFLSEEYLLLLLSVMTPVSVLIDSKSLGFTNLRNPMVELSSNKVLTSSGESCLVAIV